MAVADYFFDTSAEARASNPAVHDRLWNLLDRGLVATCGILNLEALWSAQSVADYERMWQYRAAIFEYVDSFEEDMQRAQEVQRNLAKSGQLRSVPLPDLMIAAVAEREGLTILHYDQDFDLVAAVTGQAVEWIAPPGSL